MLVIKKLQLTRATSPNMLSNLSHVSPSANGMMTARQPILRIKARFNDSETLISNYGLVSTEPLCNPCCIAFERPLENCYCCATLHSEGITNWPDTTQELLDCCRGYSVWTFIKLWNQVFEWRHHSSAVWVVLMTSCEQRDARIDFASMADSIAMNKMLQIDTCWDIVLTLEQRKLAIQRQIMWGTDFFE